MWDWTNDGAQDAGMDKADFGVRRLLDGATAYSVYFRFRLKRSGKDGVIFSESNDLVQSGKGVTIKHVYDSGADKFAVVHNATTSVLSPAITSGNDGYLFTWDSANGLTILKAGNPFHTDAAFLTVPSIPGGIGLAVGADLGGSLPGPNGFLCGLMIWPQDALNDEDAIGLDDDIIAHRASLRFLLRGSEMPGRDEYTRRVPDCYRYDPGNGQPQKLPILFFDNVKLYTEPTIPELDHYWTVHAETPREEMAILAGEELHRRRLPVKNYGITVPTEFLTKELMDDLQLTHRGGLECTGEGFGYGSAPERLVRIERMMLDPETRNVGLSLRDMKRQAVSYYNSFRAKYTVTGRRVGVFELYPTYAKLEAVRDSFAWAEETQGGVPSPATERIPPVVQEFGRDQIPVTPKGLLVESKKRNYFINSSFKHATGVNPDNWTIIDPGTGTVTCTGPDVPAFDSSITKRAVEMAAGTPIAGNYVGIQQALAGAGAGTNMRLSFIYYALTGHPLRMRISRASDGWYLQTITGTWAAADAVLEIPIETAYKNPHRYVLPHVFDGNDTYTFKFYATGYDGNTIWMYNAQFEEGKFATSPITTEATNAYIREGTQVLVHNPDGLLLPKAHATIAFEFQSLWANDEASGTLKYILGLWHDVNNAIQIYWDVAQSKLKANWYYNSTSFLSELAALTWNAGDTLKLAIRWLAAGELGQESAQGQLFAKVASGAWQEAPAVKFTQELQEVPESILYPGGYGGAVDEHNAADGYFRYLHCFPEALPFEEIQALLGEAA